jgi:hypothetical protein
MRVIPKPEPGPARPQLALPATPSLVNGTGPIRFIRGAIRNSPWVVMAVTAHMVAFAVLSIVLVATRGTAKADTAAFGTKIVKRVVEDDPIPEEKAVERIDRKAVPAAPTEKDEGPVNPHDVIIPDAEESGVRGPVHDSDDYEHDPGEKNPDPDAPWTLPPGATGSTPIGVHGPGIRGKGPSPWVGRGGGGHGEGGHGDGPRAGRQGGSSGKKDPDTSVWAALQWLKKHQAPDGRWDGGCFDAQCKLNRCDGPGESAYSTGLTGLSLLAFLGAGETHQTGSCRETVKRGIKWLRDTQDSEGCFGPRTSQHFLYNHACAALAMAEAYGMTQSRAFKEPAQRGIGFVLKARNPYLAWRYNVPADGDNDTSVTGWMVMALKSAHMAGLEVEKSAVKDSIAWVEKMTEPEFGRTGYQQRGGPPARTNESMAKFPASKSEAMTAVGLTVRIFGGRDVKTDEMIGKGADLLVKCLPKWDVDQGTIDFYYWYYGSLAMFQVGGDRWNKWNAAMKTSLLDHQRLEKDRCEYGSWDPVDPWSGEGGRVYATAINCLTMEVYYRYPILGVRADATNK